MPVGLRRLGPANLKGIESTVIYELVDGAVWDLESLSRLQASNLNAALETISKSEAMLRRSGERPALESKENS